MSGYQCMMHGTMYIPFPSMVLWRSARRALRASFSAARSKFIFFSADLVGEGPVTVGRNGEDVDINLKLSVHRTKLAEDAAGQLGART